MFQAEKDCDENVFREAKMFTDDLSEQFKEVNSHFVDSSGFGIKGEPALTADEFLEKIKAGQFYAITGIGLFQVHVGEFIKRIKTKNKKKIKGIEKWIMKRL